MQEQKQVFFHILAASAASGRIAHQPLLTLQHNKRGQSHTLSSLQVMTGGMCMRREKRYEDLTFTDDFMFCRVLENNPDLCRELVELILDRPIGEIHGLQKQHVTDLAYDVRGVRFDVHFQDESEKIYSVEMQAYNEKNLAKRFRFYSSAMDQEQLDKGCSFGQLQDTYVIFICTYNIASQYNLAKYTFERVCMENMAYRLEDGTHLIVVCAENEDTAISDKLRNFLRYIAGSMTPDGFTSRLEKAVDIGRISKEWRREYMLMVEYLNEAKAEGKKEGREQINELNNLLVKDNRSDDLTRSIVDRDYQQKLLQEYGLTN